MERRYSKFLTIILIIIIVAIIGLLAYLGYDYYTKYRINKDSGEAVDAFIEEVTVEQPNTENTTGNNNTGNDITTNTSTNATGDSTTSTNTKRRTYKGFNMLGTIEIPKTGIKYTILEKVTKKSLETSVAVVWPEQATLNKPGNVVIVGHNYRNGVFF